jgi:diacylglycerol kinase family enzyme
VADVETSTRRPGGRLTGTVPVLLNARAKAFRRLGEAEVRSQVEIACRAAGLDTRVQFLAPKDMERTVRAAAEAGASLVVVGGGDGTVRSAAQALADVRTALGILPLGNHNHCARDLGLPLDLAAAARVIAAGDIRPVDLGELNGDVFVNNSALGLYPYLVREREEHERRFGWSRLKALARATWRTFWHFPVLELDVLRPPEIGRIESPLVFVGNNEYAFGPRLGRRARLDGGSLWLCAVQPMGRWRFLWLCLRSLVVSEPGAKHFACHALEEMAIDLPHSTWVSLDGEVRRIRGRLHYRIRPRALLVAAGPSPGPLAASPEGSAP